MVGFLVYFRVNVSSITVKEISMYDSEFDDRRK